MKKEITSLRAKRGNPIKILILALVVIGICGFIFRGWIAAPSARNDNTETKPTVKIGVILPLTGNSADVGVMAKDAILLALNEKNQDELNYKYVFIIEDDQFKSSITAPTANKFIFTDKVSAIMTYYAPAGFIVNPLAEQNKIIHLGNTWEEDVSRGKFNIIQYTTMDEMIDKSIQHIKQKNISDVAIITEVRGTSEKYARKAEKALKEQGFRVAFDSFNRGERDFRILIRKLQQDGYNFFIVNTIRPEFDIILKQLHEAGVSNDYILATGGDTLPDMSLYEGVVFAGASTGTEDFINKYQSTYGRAPGYGSVISYDLANLLIKAYEDNYIPNKLPDNEKVLEYIYNQDVYGCGAIKCIIDENGYIKNPAILRQVKDGKYINLD